MAEEKQIEESKGVLVGIDLETRSLQISCYHSSLQEPETIGMHVGIEKFHIPLCLFKQSKASQWYYGEAAQKQRELTEGVFVEKIWEGCLHNKELTLEDKTYSFVELLVILLKRVLRLACQTGSNRTLEGIVFTVDKLDAKKIALLQKVAIQLPVERKHILFQDYKESFYYYVLNQKKEFWNREVFLFHFTNRCLRSYRLVVNQRVKPYEALIQEVGFEEFSDLEEDFYTSEEKRKAMDHWFFKAVQTLFKKRLVSSVYLIGDGFDNGWMEESLRLLCHGRRVFQGKNLFTKGACYACMEQLGWKEMSGRYNGEHALGSQVRIPVLIHGAPDYVCIAKGQEPWYAAGLLTECILDDCSEIPIEIIPLGEGKESRVTVLELECLPKRPNLATKLQIKVEFISNKNGMLTVKDLGFGELYESSGMEWEKSFTL